MINANRQQSKVKSVQLQQSKTNLAHYQKEKLFANLVLAIDEYRLCLQQYKKTHCQITTTTTKEERCISFYVFRNRFSAERIVHRHCVEFHQLGRVRCCIRARRRRC